MIFEDEGQKIGKHTSKNSYWKNHGVEVVRVPLPCGDYVKANEKILDVLKRKQERGLKPKKMDFLGTYDVAIDTKFSIQELVGDICGKQHERFRDECILAQNNGIQLYVLVQNDIECVSKKHDLYNYPIHDLKQLHRWVNKRLWIRKNGKQVYPKATRGITLMKACYSMEKKYDVKFLFCTTQEAGAKVLEILGVDKDVK